MLIEGNSYTCTNSSLVVEVIKIKRVGKRYTNAILLVINKLNSTIYGTREYKLLNTNLLHWYIYNK